MKNSLQFRLNKTKLMGILNVTPDSFFDGGKFRRTEEAIAKAIALFESGADWLDIGGESSRPGSLPVSIEEELARVLPVIEALVKIVPIPLSIDTTKPLVAKKALDLGVSMINDISGFINNEMVEVAKAHPQSLLCVMHMKGTPKVMQDELHYEQGVIPHILNFFHNQIETLLASGIKKERIILDPGIGFGKSVAHNGEILQNLHKFTSLGYPILIGLSRKSFMGKLLNLPKEDLLFPTLALNSLCIQSGVDYIRVHDVQEHRAAIDIIESIKNGLV